MEFKGAAPSLLLLALFLRSSSTLSINLSTSQNSLTGITDVLCTTDGADSLEWSIRAKFTDLNLEISAELVQSSASGDVVVTEGITMSSVFRTSSMNEQLNIVTSTMRVSPSFVPQGVIQFTCISHDGLNSARGTSFLNRINSDLESPPNDNNNESTTPNAVWIVAASVAILITLAVITTFILCLICKIKRNNADHINNISHQNIITAVTTSPTHENSEPASINDPEYFSIILSAPQQDNTASATSTITEPDNENSRSTNVIVTSNVSYFSVTPVNVPMTHNESYGILQNSTNARSTEALASVGVTNIRSEGDNIQSEGENVTEVGGQNDEDEEYHYYY